MRPRLGNRVGLCLVGLALVAIGLGLLIGGRAAGPLAGTAGAGVTGAPVTGTAVTGTAVTGTAVTGASMTEGRPWVLPLLAGASTLLALLATRWLVMALGWGRLGSRTGTGIAMLGVALKGIEGIARISVRLVRDGRVRMSLSVLPSADLRQVIGRLDESAVSRVRRAVDRDGAPVLVRLHVRRR